MVSGLRDFMLFTTFCYLTPVDLKYELKSSKYYPLKIINTVCWKINREMIKIKDKNKLGTKRKIIK